MSNAYHISFLASATVVDHNDYVAFWSNQDHITEFVATQIDADLIAAAQSGDWYDMERIASDVALFTSFENMTDDELHERVADLSLVNDWNAEEGKYEIGESDYAWHLIYVIEDLLGDRRAREQYQSPRPLVYTIGEVA